MFAKKIVVLKVGLMLGLGAAIGFGAAATRTNAPNLTVSKTLTSHDPWVDVLLEGAERWYTLAQLKSVSDGYLLRQEPEIEMHTYLVTASIQKSEQGLVVFQYFENLGTPVYYVFLDDKGGLIEIVSRIASEKTGVQDPGAAP